MRSSKVLSRLATFAILTSLPIAVVVTAGVIGRNSAPILRHLFETVGRSDTSEFSLDVIGAGDQNGDGFADLLVSARGDRDMYLFLGGSPMDTFPKMVFHNTRYGTVADVNGDGFKDFIFGEFHGQYGVEFRVKLYYGGPLLDTIPDAFFSSTDSGDGFLHPYGIGDFNGDGYEDIAVTAYAFPHGMYQGKVRVYFGGNSVRPLPDWTVVGDSLWNYFGIAITAGDLNGDGYSDLAIGSFPVVAGNWYRHMKIFLGGNPPDTVAAFMIHGYEVGAVVGDVNGDGFDDLSATNFCNCDTAAVIFFGGNPMDTIPGVVLKRSAYTGSGPAWVISGAGDINKDGYVDILLGNRRGFGGYGEVLVYLGGPNMTGKFDFGFTGLTNSYEGAGIAVGRAGDVDGDHVDDIMFGSQNSDPGFSNPRGMVEIFAGDSTVTGIAHRSADPLPNSFQLGQNYPNPFNPETHIPFSIPSIQTYGLIVHVSMTIFDAQGREVRKLLEESEFTTGQHEVVWDGRDSGGHATASGIYFYRMSINGHYLTKTMILIR
jgi:hypothetical protein